MNADPHPTCFCCRWFGVILVGVLGMLPHPATIAQPTQPSEQFFTEQVGPILEQNCLNCHHPDNDKGDLSLATKEDLTKQGLLEEPSVFLRVIQSSDGKAPEMPKKGPPLSSQEQKTLIEWVSRGAPWPQEQVLLPSPDQGQQGWAFQPLFEGEPPASAMADHPIDRFVIHSLEEKGLSLSPPADRGTLVRRLYYDLTGLPPSSAEILAFTQDTDPQAYEKLVDRLLHSPAYGERWGRHWLDVIRFGESRGFERNEIILNAWPFRDYVIDSFNADKPLDQLILEHLAGDQLAPNDPSVSVGTTFLVCGPYDDVGNQDPAQAAQIRANTIDEIIRATSEAFLGLTVGCSRCHDHKFDPISQEDYYRWYATFRGVRHGSREMSSSEEKELRQKALKPLQEETQQLETRIQELQESILKRAQKKDSSMPMPWKRGPIQRTGVEETFDPIEAQYVRLVVEGAENQPGRQSGYGIDEFEIWNTEKPSRNVALLSEGTRAVGKSRVAEDFSDAYSANLTIDGKWGARWMAQGPTLTLTLVKPTTIDRVLFSSDRGGDAGDHGVANFICEYRLEASLDGTTWRSIADSHDREPMNQAHREHRWLQKETTDSEREQLREWKDQLQEVKARINALPELPRWWAGTFHEIQEPTHVFLGGDPQRKAQITSPASLSAFNASVPTYSLAEEAPEAQRRLALAKWLTSANNPLPARVWANRIWQYHFGQGLVGTPSDFGLMGQAPSHPELLDWLARRLMAGGWQLKPFHRMILLSEAYRQGSAYHAEGGKIDAENRFLWRFSPRRLSAEEIRDSMLAAAGVLNRRMGGPGFRLYRYLQDNVATYVPLDQHGSETWRRAVYHHHARASVIDLMSEFDCPDPAFASPKRSVTTTPLQALTLMNHSFTQDMAQAMASRLDAMAGKDDEAWIREACLQCFGRLPTQEETAAMKPFKESMGGALLCRTLFNANAFIHLD